MRTGRRAKDELCRVHDDAGAHLVRSLRHPPGFDPRARRVLDHAEGGDRRGRIDRVDQILREVSVGAVLLPPLVRWGLWGWSVGIQARWGERGMRARW